MRVDGHQHFWRHDPVRDAWITDEMSVLRRDFMPEELEKEMATAGVDGCVAVQADTSEDETRFLLQLAEHHGFIRGVVGWVDLCAANLAERLDHFAASPHLCGVRHIVQAEADDYLERPDVVRGLGMLGDFGLTYDLLLYPRQLASALAVARRLPHQPFVVDHVAKPEIRRGIMDPWAAHMRELAACPNVWCKVSGLVTEADWADWRPEHLAPYLDVVFDAFGPGRLMFGSDWPVCLLAAGYQDVLGVVEDYAAQLSVADRQGLFGGNATRFYGLQD